LFSGDLLTHGTGGPKVERGPNAKIEEDESLIVLSKDRHEQSCNLVVDINI